MSTTNTFTAGSVGRVLAVVWGVGLQVGCMMPTDAQSPAAATSARVVMFHLDASALEMAGVPATVAGTSVSVELLRVGVSGLADTQEVLRGALVTLVDVMGTSVELPEDPDLPGFYRLATGEEGAAELGYMPGSLYRVEISHHGQEYWLGGVVPDYPEVVAPAWKQAVSPTDPLDVAWQPEESHAGLMVVDEGGAVRFSNVPELPGEIESYLARSCGESGTVPAGVFSSGERFGLAVAAMKSADFANDHETRLSMNLHPGASVFLSGYATVTQVLAAQ